MHAYYTTCYILHISVVKISFIPFSNEIDIIFETRNNKNDLPSKIYLLA